RIRRLVQNVGQHSHCTITMHLRQPEDGLAAHVGVGIGLRDVQQYVHRLWRRFLRDEEDSFPAKRRRALIAAREHLFKDWLGTIRIHLKKCIEGGDALVVVFIDALGRGGAAVASTTHSRAGCLCRKHGGPGRGSSRLRSYACGTCSVALLRELATDSRRERGSIAL